MGDKHSWVAFEGASPDQVCKAIDVRRTGNYQRRSFNGSVSGILLPSNWYVVLREGDTSAYPSDEEMALLPMSRRIVSCSVYDVSMYSAVHGWVDGKEVWSVEHADESSKYDLIEWGTVPEAIHAAKKKQFQLQDEAGGEKADVEHVYDVPMELAFSITGFRYRGDIGDVGDEPYEELIDPDATPSKSVKLQPAIPESTKSESAYSTSWWRRLLRY